MLPVTRQKLEPRPPVMAEREAKATNRMPAMTQTYLHRRGEEVTQNKRPISAKNVYVVQLTVLPFKIDRQTIRLLESAQQDTSVFLRFA